jgi:aspartyl aminopeptidase
MDVENAKKQIFAEDLISFINNSPTPFHVVKETKKRLVEKGFKELKEDTTWVPCMLSKKKKYFVTRGGTSLIAFVLGQKNLEETGFKIIGAHTDSPTLKLKPNALYNKSGCAMLGVEPYGGGIWRSWLDRDLFIAGRVTVRKDGKLFSHLIDLWSVGPIVGISELAIHLQREVNEQGAVNVQTDLPAIFGLEGATSKELFDALLKKPDEEVVSFDLSLCDAQPGTLAGMNDEFIHSGRLDDLASVHQALTAITEVEKPEATVVAVFWDHEEVGSSSAQGASGSFLKDVLKRICDACGRHEKAIFAKSFLISSDNAHAVLPNHPEKHEANHMPKIGGGPVIKYNANLRYATNDMSAGIFANVCHIAGVKYQNFVSRSDLPCGSTIGSIVSPKLGILTVDVGTPQWAMHSIREKMGVNDHYDMYQVFKTFYARDKEEVETSEE